MRMDRVFPMLWVADVPASVRFHEDGLGGVVDHAHDDGSYAEVQLGSMTLGLVAEAEARRHLPVPFRPYADTDVPAAFELYLEVPDADEVAARAIAAGATLLAPPSDKPWGRRVAYLRDPNGVVVELASPLG
jgi:lactoylglutathione lyase